MSGTLVDLNCDMGESFGAYRIGSDEAVLESVSSANVACGFHGGDPRVIRDTVMAAKRAGVSVGAHPGFPDLVGFGRRNLDATPDEVRTDVLYQIGAVHGFARAAGVTLQHVKPHGQLNNLAVKDHRMAAAIVAGIRDFDQDLILVAYGGELFRAAEEAGLSIGYEVFADREYNADGTLVSRKLPGAVIHDVERVVRRAVTMVREGHVQAITGETIPLRVDTICVHGDTPGAADIARALRMGLERSGVRIRSLRDVVEARAAARSEQI